MQGGSIIPVGHPHQHAGEADPSDDLSILIALDENGTLISSSIKEVLFELVNIEIY